MTRVTASITNYTECYWSIARNNIETRKEFLGKCDNCLQYKTIRCKAEIKLDPGLAIRRLNKNSAILKRVNNTTSHGDGSEGRDESERATGRIY